MARTCENCGKVIFRDQMAAKLALFKGSSRKRERGEKRAYRCPHGHGWHLTSKR